MLQRQLISSQFGTRIALAIVSVFAVAGARAEVRQYQVEIAAGQAESARPARGRLGSSSPGR